MKKQRTDSLEYIAKKHKKEQEEYLKAGVVKRVALYARQSVDKKDSISIDTQLDACRRLLKENEPYKEYTDKGYSGKDTNRPAFQQMLRDLHAGKISKIIVYKIDRCSRSVLDFYQLVHTLDTLGCGFVSVKEEHIDTTVPTGKLMIGISAVFAEFERETIQLRITDNYYSRIERDGRWPGGPAPYGYRVKPHSKPSMLEYEPTEIEAVKIIYDKYYNDSSISLVRIVRDLEALGFKGRKGKNFRTTAILNVLRNPIYVKADSTLYYYFQSLGVTMVNPIEEWTGEQSAHLICNQQGKKYTANNYENCIAYLTNIKGFIDSSRYIKIQERLKTNKQMARGNKPSKMEWLAGLLKCAKCGYGIRIYSHEHKYLSCFGKSVMHECTVTFSVKNITFEQVKEKVATQIQEHIHDIEHIVQERKANWFKLQKEIEKEEADISRLVQLALIVDVKEIGAQIKEKQTRINTLKLQGDFFTEQLAQYEDIDFIALSDDEKKKVANELIERILLSEDGSIKIVWKI